MAGILKIPGVCVLFFYFLTVPHAVAGNSLHQIVILSRHNLRTPLSQDLQRFTTNRWPKWDEPLGYLTQKGALLESYMGNYFSAWMQAEGLLDQGCSERTVYAYSNWPQRTKETAKQFVKIAFKSCNNNITVHSVESNYDPNFTPLIHDDSEQFQADANKEFQKELAKVDLKDAFTILNEILDLNNSAVCKKEGLCDLNKGKNNIILEYDEEPDIDGPIKFANQIVDAFLMEFYDGKPDTEVAWGRIRPEDWKILLKVTEANQKLRFRCPTITRDVAKPMTDYIRNIFLNNTSNITLLVGHDSTISSTLANLKLKPYELPDQFEKTPIGGKVVFQKRFDNGRYYLKIEYVYQTFEQLRNGTMLSLDSPPNSHVLELSNCTVNEHGMCPWEDFTRILLDS